MPLTKKKCYSKCRKKTESECGPKICKYINGKKYHYCRLGYKYKLDENCNITRRKFKTKITKKQAQLRINNFFHKIKTRKNKIDDAAKKIKTFMQKNRFKIKSRFLQSICSDSGICLAFGKNSVDIKLFFNNFTDFRYANAHLKRLGEPSNNGFVNEISFEREKYKAHSIIKSSAKVFTDNLFYEYLCGLVINEWSLRFPCFLETYGLFLYKNNESWSKIKNNRITTVASFEKQVSLLNNNKLHFNSNLFEELLKNSCLRSKHIAIMIQHLKNAVTLEDFFNNEINKNYFVNNDLVIFLFQIYFPLHVLNNNFTHYDLHTSNVLLYKPYSNGYIHYHYILSNGKTIQFKSPYMIKIIDYGRSFFKNDAFNSKDILNKLCLTSECDPNCGGDYGFAWLNKTGPIRSQSYILSSVSNKSHDLRLLYIVKSNFKSFKIEKPQKNVFSLYNNLIKNLKYNTDYGTPEAKENKYPKYIETVSDAFKGLTDLLLDPEFINRNNIDTLNFLKIGDLYVYEDGRPMKFSN